MLKYKIPQIVTLTHEKSLNFNEIQGLHHF